MSATLIIPACSHPLTDTLPYTNSLFEEPWWLDAVAPGAWGAATVVKGGEVFARIPYAIRKKHGLSLAGNPPLTPTLGPWFRPTTAKYAGRLSLEKELLDDLIAQLPRCDLFRQSFSPGMTNALPFRWNGYEYSLTYTYRIHQLNDLDHAWGELTNERRNIVRKAQKEVTIRDDLSTGAFYDIIEETCTRQGLNPPITRECFCHLDEACRSRAARKILHAEDASSNVHAVVYVVWDHRAAYYLLGGGHPSLKRSGAQSLLIWEAIKFASSVSPVFDFCGSSRHAIEHFFSSFGARQTPLLSVRRMSRRFAVLKASKDLAWLLAGRRAPCFL